MIGSVMVISLVFTIAVLALTLLTISKGYGYKHTIDAKEVDEETKEVRK